MVTAAIKTIAIIGAGAIGGWIGGKLALAGHDVRILARGATLDLIRTDGLLVDDDEPRVAPVRAFGSADEIGVADLLIVAVKAPALGMVAEIARPLIGPDTLVLPMLNGVPWWFLAGEALRSVDPDGRIDAALPQTQLVGCVVHASCSRTAPNRVAVKHAERLILGEPSSGSSPRIELLRTLFEGAGIRADASDDIRRAIWYKLWGNATLNPLSALTRSTADCLLGDPAIRRLMLEGMAELAEIGAAIGCPIAESGDDRMAVTARLGAFKTSMLQDVEAGRKIELEALLGAPIEIARRRGIASPRLDEIYATTRLMAESLKLL